MNKKVIRPLMVTLTSLVLFSCSLVIPPVDTVVNLAVIDGVTIPVFGATPVTTISETSQYTGTVAWNGAPATFAASTVYTATITLTAKAGYTLTGTTTDFFTVTGASSDTNPVHSGVVMAIFPATLNFRLTMATVPAGSFQRDATATNISTISNYFLISEKEITLQKFVAATGLVNPSSSFTTVVNGPVQTVSWYHALVFCNKMSIAEGLTPAYTILDSTVPDAWDGTVDGIITVPTSTDADWDAAVCNWSANGYRLPTEMEWMWAAIGATSGSGYSDPTYLTGYCKLFAGSDSISEDGSGGTKIIGDYAWYSVNSENTTKPVGTTGGAPANANELGLYDMSGNVWEWMWDRYGSYPTGALTDYRGMASGLTRVTRGGGWSYIAASCTVAARGASNPSNRPNSNGFRVVRP